MSTAATLMNYSLLIQQLDADSNVEVQAKKLVALKVPDGVVGDDSFVIPSGSVDFELPLLKTPVNFVAVLPRGDVTFKLNTLAGTPIPIRSDGLFMLDGSSVTAIYITNGGLTDIKIRIITAIAEP